MGLVLNVNKCEFISHPSTIVSDPALHSFQRVSVSDTVLLETLVLQGQSLDKHWSDRCNDLSRAVDRLTKVASQDALILLRAFLALRECSIYCGVLRQLTMRLLPRSTTLCGPLSALLPTPNSPIHSGFRRLCQLGMVAWELEGYPLLHFPPLWPLQ